MKRTPLAGLILLLCAVSAHAGTLQKTRDQVRAELADAVRTGDIVDGDSSLSRRELHPQRYPAVVAPGKTRAQVEAELADAIRHGDIASEAGGLQLRELYPQRYPAASAVTGKTRAQVRAEWAEAVRTGDIYANTESNLKLNELDPSRYANVQTSDQGARPLQQAASSNGNPAY